MEFKDRLKELRKQDGYSQSEIANVLGISQQGYGRYEQGLREPNIETLLTLASLFRVTTDHLLGVDNKNDMYIFSAKVAEIATEIYQREDLYKLFHMAKGVSKEKVSLIIDVLEQMK